MNANLIAVIILVVVVIALILLLQTKYKKYASEILLYLVIEAEKEFGGGTGQLKYSAVFTWLYEKLPTLAKIILPKKVISDLIETAVGKMKEYLESNIKASEFVSNDVNSQV